MAPGSKPIMFYTLMMLGAPGAEIVCPDPGMPEFEAVARFAARAWWPCRTIRERNGSISIASPPS